MSNARSHFCVDISRLCMFLYFISDALLREPNIIHLSKSVSSHFTKHLISLPDQCSVIYTSQTKWLQPLSTLISTFSCGARWQQPDYKLLIYLIHFCDLEKTNFSRRCCSPADRLDLLSVVFYWILQRTVQATFFLFEKRLPCRLEEILFAASAVPNFESLWKWSEVNSI